MEDKCENCKYFRRLYVPNTTMFGNLNKDGYVCTAKSEVLYLGTKGQGANLGWCNRFRASLPFDIEE